MLDFERHDDDELGFRKNDIVTVCCGAAAVAASVASSVLRSDWLQGCENKISYVAFDVSSDFPAKIEELRECMSCRIRVREEEVVRVFS